MKKHVRRNAMQRCSLRKPSVKQKKSKFSHFHCKTSTSSCIVRMICVRERPNNPIMLGSQWQCRELHSSHCCKQIRCILAVAEKSLVERTVRHLLYMEKRYCSELIWVQFTEEGKWTPFTAFTFLGWPLSWHIWLDLTWLDSSMSTSVDFKRLETFRSCGEFVWTL